MVGCYLVWTWRNKAKFDDSFTRPQYPSNMVIQQAHSILIVFFSGRISEPPCMKEIHVNWRFPPMGWAKLNSDGATKGNPGTAGCGGLIRVEDGHWITWFVHNFGICSSFVAELFGLEFAWSKGIRRLIVESDSKAIISMLDAGAQERHHNRIFSKILGWHRKRMATSVYSQIW